MNLSAINNDLEVFMKELYKWLIGYAAAASTASLVFNYWRYVTEKSKPVTYIDPPELPKPVGYSHIAIVPQDGDPLAFIAGQASLSKDEENVVIGVDDTGVQAKNAYANLLTALTSIGSKPCDVVKSNIYCKEGYTESDLEVIIRERDKMFALCSKSPPGALIVVKSLALDDLKVEVDAIAKARGSHVK